jgi:hypothetical protein
MSFSASSEGIKLISGGVIGATCKTATGGLNNSALDLNQVLGNNNGFFSWGGKDFEASARNISLSGSTLKAELRRIDGSWAWSSVNLDERITNSDGNLKYQF